MTLHKKMNDRKWIIYEEMAIDVKKPLNKEKDMYQYIESVYNVQKLYNIISKGFPDFIILYGYGSPGFVECKYIKSGSDFTTQLSDQQVVWINNLLKGNYNVYIAEYRKGGKYIAIKKLMRRWNCGDNL